MWGTTMSENDLSVLAVPKNLGPEVDFFLVMHMGWKH
jgi:hypothetical protein